MQVREALGWFVIKHPEYFETSADLVTKREFAQLALADVGLLSLCKRVFIATLDDKLYPRIVAAGGQAVRFNHVREATLPHRANEPRGF